MSGLSSEIMLETVAIEDTRVRLSMLLLEKIDGGIWRLFISLRPPPPSVITRADACG